jgi:hypothetical protein
VDEDEHKIGLEKERFLRIETRCQAAEKELEELRRDYKNITDDNVKMTRQSVDQKDQLKILNENLKHHIEVSKANEN